MKSIELNEAALIATAESLAATFKQKDVKGAGKMRCLQALCQHFYSKPYEELQKTLFASNASSSTTNSPDCRVVLLRYTTEIAVLTLDGEFYTSSYSNTDTERDFEHMTQDAARLATLHKTEYRVVALPEALSEDDAQDENNIIALAQYMHIFDYKETLFEQLMDDDIKILIDGSLCPYTLDGDMNDHLQESIDEDDVFDTCIWHAEFTDNQGVAREFFFSLEDIAKAKPCSNPKCWLVPYFNDELIKIEIR